MSIPSIPSIPSVPSVPTGFFSLVGGLVAGLALGVAGCIGEMNLGAVRLDWGLVSRAAGDDFKRSDEGRAYGFEIARGTDADPEFGPIHFAFAFSRAEIELPGFDDDTFEHRMGTRWRSSVLDHNTSSYPYAALGVYGAYVEPGNESGGRWGAGLEGGYGLRLGLGPRAALDLDVMASFGVFEGGFGGLSSRIGGAFAVRY